MLPPPFRAMDPADDLAWLAVADWLEEHDQPDRAELTRLTRLLRHDLHGPDRRDREDRLMELLAAGVEPCVATLTNSIGMEFALIPPGTFMMGSPENEEERFGDETRHKVTLTQGYLMATHPVTQACWREVMGNNPSRFKGDDLPVEQVSWEDCQEFLCKLSGRDGRSYRLPTEAEWEFACRAGTTTAFSTGKTITREQARFGDPEGRTAPVGGFPPNAWGLYDMHGNVWELCADWYGEYPEGEVVDPKGPERGGGRIERGGSYWPPISYLRSANRSCNAPTYKKRENGFRPAIDLVLR
jgi:formylglycine-generating enzyme